MDWFTLENHGRITSDGKINGRYMMDKVHNLLKFEWIGLSGKIAGSHVNFSEWIRYKGILNII